MSTDALWATDMPTLYDRHLVPALFAPFATLLAERLRDEAPPSTSSVLELAAGTGALTRALLRALPGPPRVTATDLNPDMVRAGDARVPEASWRQADALSLPFGDEEFDATVCAFGVMFFPDTRAAFREARRVLVPGGRFMFTVWDRLETCAFPEALTEAVAAAVPEDPPDFVARVPHGYCDPGRIRDDLHAAGLVPRSLETVALQAGAASARSLAEGFCRGTPLRFALERHGDLDLLTDRVAEGMVDRLGRGEVEGPLRALLVTASRPDPGDPGSPSR